MKQALRRQMLAALALLSVAAMCCATARAELVTLGTAPGAVTSFHDGGLVWPAVFDVNGFFATVAGTVTLSVQRVEWGDPLSLITTVSLVNRPGLEMSGNALRTFEISAGESFTTSLLAMADGPLGYGAYQLDVSFLPKMSQVPLPATAGLLLSGLCALLARRRRSASRAI